MQFDRTGIILYVNEYTTCVHFYEKLLQLPKLFETEILTCFAFGETYLMVELDDQDLPDPPSQSRIRTCLRMNVKEVKKRAQQLVERGIEVDYQEHSWGIVAKFFDPDGNLLAFKDSEKSELQFMG